MATEWRRIAYYITPHGLGHAVRSLEIIHHLQALAVDLEVVLVSTLPEQFVLQNLGRPLPIRRRQLDIGLVQQDSLRFDLEATRLTLESLYRDRDRLLSEEHQFLNTNQIAAVVCDIPFIPFVAAASLGIPAVGISNFTWDWIYQAYARQDSRWTPLVNWIRDCYRECPLFLQLPMHGDCSSCPEIKDVPLVSRRAGRTREATRQILGLSANQRVYLVSFAALELEREAQERIQEMMNTVFLYKSPLSFRFRNGLCLDSFALSYADVVGAVDGVITKPGYGIVADCRTQGTPIVYADRGFFPEYDILVQEMKMHLNVAYLSASDLYAGRWQSAIEQLEKQARKVPELPSNGAEICAQEILSLLE
jgi:L-arabinokinase